MSTDFIFSKRSRRHLNSVHGDLRRVAERALEITPIDFTVIDGLRSIAQQRDYYNTGKSKAMKSAHLIGGAIDIVGLVDNSAEWSDKTFRPVIDAFKYAAAELGIPITCGYDWRWRDMPHIELHRAHYAAYYQKLDDIILDTPIRS